MVSVKVREDAWEGRTASLWQDLKGLAEVSVGRTGVWSRPRGMHRAHNVFGFLAEMALKLGDVSKTMHGHSDVNLRSLHAPGAS